MITAVQKIGILQELIPNHSFPTPDLQRSFYNAKNKLYSELVELIKRKSKAELYNYVFGIVLIQNVNGYDFYFDSFLGEEIENISNWKCYMRNSFTPADFNSFYTPKADNYTRHKLKTFQIEDFTKLILHC